MSTDAAVQTLLAGSANPWIALGAKATLTMAAALLALRTLRRAPASWRHLLVAAAFGALLLLPLVAGLAPAHVVALGAPRAVALPAAAAGPSVNARAPVAVASSAARPRGASLPRPSMGAVLGAVYGAGVLAVLASLMAGVVRLHRLHARSEVSVRGTRLAMDLARVGGLARGVQVVTSDELAVPMTFGSLRPVVVLPAEAATWGGEEMTRALRHELEHVARHDWATQIVARVAFAFYWPHPLAWMLWRRLRLEAERACDDAVVRSQGQPETYAGQLVALARRVSGQGPVAALSMATRSTLGLRVESILDAAAQRRPRTRLATGAALGAALFGLAGLAPLRLVRASEVPSAAARPATSAGQVSLVRREARPAQDAQAPRSARAPQAPQPPQAHAEHGRRGTHAPHADRHEDDDHDAEGHADSDHDADDDRDDSLDMRLLKAAQRGSMAEMQRLIDAGAKAGAVLPGDGTPLIGAARGGSVEAIELLLGAGADVNRSVEGDGSPLIAAAAAGHLDAVRALLARGASIDQGVPGDGNALIMAAGAGHADVVQLLLDQGAGLETVVPGDENALIHASEAGQVEVVRLLLARGANVNARVQARGRNNRPEWRTPLSMARRNGHAEVERILRAAGARE